MTPSFIPDPANVAVLEERHVGEDQRVRPATCGFLDDAGKVVDVSAAAAPSSQTLRAGRSAARVRRVRKCSTCRIRRSWSNAARGGSHGER